jgi:cysteinyl-tRNA synthetase
VAALGCLPPTVEPRATEHIEQMKAIIEKLVVDKHAYVADGHVLFDVPSMPDYGRLSKRPMDEMIAGARVEVAPYKKDPQDFVLWKPSKPGEPAWPSPCGIDSPGRPGWHIECSAMAWKHLGETFDIHGGGIDLVFPHHENEIAQSRCAFHTPVMANYWMHNGFLQVEGEKMSKSLGNFVTLHELMTVGWRGSMPWSGHVLRFAMLMTHYRQPIDWTPTRIALAWANLETFMSLGKTKLGFTEQTILGEQLEILSRPPSGGLLGHLADDLNTAAAIASHLFSLANVAKQTGKEGLEATKQLLRDCLFLGVDPYQSIRDEWERQDQKAIQAQIAARNAARKAKNFAEADRIRDELASKGIVLKDSKDGTTWEIAR